MRLRAQKAFLAALLLVVPLLQQTEAIAAACAYSSGTVSGNLRYVTFNSGSACTWTVPSGVTSLTYLAVGGGGGGGGGQVDGGSWFGGGGGGAGGLVISNTLSVTAGSAITLTVGIGGSGGAAASNGGNGTSTTLTNSGTTYTASGGNGGAGATGTYAQNLMAGDGGSNGLYSGGGNDWDGGGGGAGSAGNGSAGIDIGGQGGNGGDGGSATLSTILGNNRYFGGGGGGGGTPHTSSSENDGFGGAGGNSVGGNGGGGAGNLATAGAANTGSGGGGGPWRYGAANSLRAGAAGADGTIIFTFTKVAGSINSLSITTSSGSDNTYKIGDSIRVTIVTSDATTVTGSPRIPVLGLTGKYFTYYSGSGTTSITFSYSVASGDSATAGVGVTANSLALNSGTIVDSAGIALNLNHGAISVASNHAVDGILPELSGVSQTISVPENETRTINLTTTEPATFAWTGVDDRAFFILDNVAKTLTLTPRDFENKRDSDSDNMYYVGLTLTDAAGNTTGGRNFFITITDVAEVATIGTPTLSSPPIKGTNVTISVTADVQGKVDFYWNGRKIPGCINIATSGTAPSLIAQCIWKPASMSLSRINAKIRPTSSSYTSATSITLSVLPARRTTLR